MEIAQRVLLTAVVMIFVVFSLYLVCNGTEEKLQTQWEKIQTELFLEGVCRTGQVSLDRYSQYISILNSSGCCFEIVMEEYQQEQDWEGNEYYYPVSWDELKRCLLEQESWMARENSVIKITVLQKKNGTMIKNDYYGIVSGKGTE